MFKRYKLQKKPRRCLKLSSKAVKPPQLRKKEGEDKVIGMLGHTSSVVQTSGAREASKLACLSEQAVKLLVKMAAHPKKEVRKQFYKTLNLLLSKSTESDLMIWEEHLFTYHTLLTKCSVIEVRRDSLFLLDALITYYPHRTEKLGTQIMTWLEKDRKTVSLDPDTVPGSKASGSAAWVHHIDKCISRIQNLKKKEPIQASFSDTINVLTKYAVINGKLHRM